MTEYVVTFTGTTDDTSNVQSALNTASGLQKTFVIDGIASMHSSGVKPKTDTTVIFKGDVLNNHDSPLIGTQGVIGNTTGLRQSNVTFRGQGGTVKPGLLPENGANRKGYMFVKTDNFAGYDLNTAGPLNGFALHIEDCTNGVISRGAFMSGRNTPGADGLHAYGPNSNVVHANCLVSSGDDARSITIEAGPSGQISQNITHSGGTADSKAFSCFKVHLEGTSNCIIQDITFDNVKGRITEGPNGGPIIVMNDTINKGGVVRRLTFNNTDTDFGKATAEGSHAYLMNSSEITMLNCIFRGRTGHFLRLSNVNGFYGRINVQETVTPNYPDALRIENGCKNVDVVLTMVDQSGIPTGKQIVFNNTTNQVIPNTTKEF